MPRFRKTRSMSVASMLASFSLEAMSISTHCLGIFSADCCSAAVRPPICYQRRWLTDSFRNQGTASFAKIETFSQRGFDRYENVKLDFRGSSPVVRHCRLARSKPGQNLDSNWCSRRNVAGRESFDRTWLGWHREGTLVG